jgi:pyridoxal phosphate enzyme (YggS family)
VSDASIAARLARVQADIRRAAEGSGRPADAVRLIAVSKTMPVDVVREALDAGVVDLGENRIQEAEEKIPALRAYPARWHLIGHLQSNKANKALRLFDVIHTVDTPELAALLSRRASREGARATVLFEVNVAGEATKQGFARDGLLASASALAVLPGLTFAGLMTVAPAAADPEAVRPVFRDLKTLRDRLAVTFGPQFRELSMGMSHDFAVAIEEGATMVRIGTAIFGERRA